MSKRGLFSRTAALAFALLVAASLTVLRAGQAPAGTVAIDADDIGGVVTGAKGPEAGVWVIAETRDTPTRLIKSVVTDDQGRYLVPDLPKGSYDVWVRGYGLVDSPAAQCTWVVEKFWDWTDCDGRPENVLSRDELLDNVMFYWVPGTGASSARLYWESFHETNTEPVSAPFGCSIFPKEIFRPSRRWVEQRFSDLRYFNEPDRGGHFAAFEQPEIFVDEVRSFFRLVER
jgi:hypothetical protein